MESFQLGLKLFVFQFPGINGAIINDAYFTALIVIERKNTRFRVSYIKDD